MVEKEERDLAKGALINVIGTLAKSSKALFLVVLPRLFGATSFGSYILITSIIETVNRFTSGGLEWGALRHIVQLQAKDPSVAIRPVVFAMARRLCFITAAFSTAVALLCKPAALYLFSKPDLVRPMQLACCALPLLNLQSLFLYAIRSSRKMQYELYVKSLVEPLVLIGFGTLFYYVMPDIHGILLAYLLSTLVGLFLATFFFMQVFPPAPNGATPINWPALYRYSLPMSGMDLLNAVKNKLDLFVIGRFLPLDLVGVYGAVVELGNLVRKVRLLFEPVFMPIVAHLHEVKERKRLQRQFVLTVRWTIVTSMVLLGPMALEPGLFLLPFGERFLAGSQALGIVTLGMFVYITIGLSDSILSMTGHSMTNLFNSIILVILNLALDLFLIPRFGLVGAAWASTLSLIFVSLWRMQQTYALVGVQPFGPSQFKPLLAAFIAWVVTSPVKKLWAPQIYWQWVIVVLIFLAVFFIVWIRVFGLEPEDRSIAEKIRNRISRLTRRRHSR